MKLGLGISLIKNMLVLSGHIGDIIENNSQWVNEFGSTLKDENGNIYLNE